MGTLFSLKVRLSRIARWGGGGRRRTNEDLTIRSFRAPKLAVSLLFFVFSARVEKCDQSRSRNEIASFGALTSEIKYVHLLGTAASSKISMASFCQTPHLKGETLQPEMYTTNLIAITYIDIRETQMSTRSLFSPYMSVPPTRQKCQFSGTFSVYRLCTDFSHFCLSFDRELSAPKSRIAVR